MLFVGSCKTSVPAVLLLLLSLASGVVKSLVLALRSVAPASTYYVQYLAIRKTLLFRRTRCTQACTYSFL